MSNDQKATKMSTDDQIIPSESTAVLFEVRIKLKQLLDDKAFRERRKITLNEVADRTGISRATINRIANVPAYNTNTDSIAALCAFLDCTPGELLDLVPKQP